MQKFQSVNRLFLILSKVSSYVTREGTKFYNKTKNNTQNIVHYSVNSLQKLDFLQVFSNDFIREVILLL